MYGEVLNATTRLGVASGIVSIWHAEPADVAATVASDRLSGQPVDRRAPLQLESYGVRLYASE